MRNGIWCSCVVLGILVFGCTIFFLWLDIVVFLEEDVVGDLFEDIFEDEIEDIELFFELLFQLFDIVKDVGLEVGNGVVGQVCYFDEYCIGESFCLDWL